MRRTSLVLVVLAACGGASSPREQQPEPEAPDAAVPLEGGDCQAVVTHETPLAKAEHVDQDSDIEWTSNPPSSGAHYPTYVEWAVNYPVRIARGNYLHNEEHGGIVMLHNCPDGGCADVIDSLEAVGKAMPQDPVCADAAKSGARPINARWLVTPDPLLPDGIVVAAAAWGWTYKATCFDRDTLNAFIAARYAQGGNDRENCAPPPSKPPSE